MIKVKLTKNYTGFHIEGTFDDFNELYDNINYFLGYEECKNLLEENMRLHLLGFLYDLRHAYQGARDIRAVPNRLTNEEKEYYGIPQLVTHDVLYSFDYVVPELIHDMLLFKHFTTKKSEEINEYNTDYNMVMSFYSKVIDSLHEIISSDEIRNIKDILVNANINVDTYYPQWNWMISIDYIKMNKTKRKKEIINIIDKEIAYHNYDDYMEMKKKVEEYAVGNMCQITDVELEKYPYEIEW